MPRPLFLALALFLAACLGTVAPARAADGTAGISMAEYAALAAQGGVAPPGATGMSPGANDAAGEPAPSVAAAQPAALPPQPDSDVFGARLFTGAFSRPGAAAFNASHVIGTGDRIHLRIWNGYNADVVLTVDAAGNVVLPEAGPLRLQGVTNGALQETVAAALRRVFAQRVSVYASLAAAQPVRVYVTGAVARPGLYDGTSGDSVLRYLDQAGGIDLDRGSFLDVTVRRDGRVLAVLNLYDFLLRGDLQLRQLDNGDVIVVAPRQHTVRVSGLAENANRFEFPGDAITLDDLAALARPLPAATHVRVVRNTGTVRNVDYVAIGAATGLTLADGDEVEYTADKRPGTITVRVEGEHAGAQEFVLPYGSRLGDLLARIAFTPQSDVDSLQLFRLSVKARQKLLLGTALHSLESSVLTARSATPEEAQVRKAEAALVLQWVERARRIEPTGQALIARSASRDQLLLENGDILRVPVKDGLVIVNGEVLFPNAVAFDASMQVEDYIGQAGGYTQNGDAARVVVAHRDGSFSDGRRDGTVRAGDEILVLPRVDMKTRQFAKDVFQILYQIAIAAKVVLGL